MNLEQHLQQYNRQDIYPMHMPGHKRNTVMMSLTNPYGLDYTEVEGLDDLHEARANPGQGGTLEESMARASRLYGSQRSFYTVGGSTAGLLAAILSHTCRGDQVLVARNCHKSVYNALVLGGLSPIYLFPEVEESFGIQGSISPGAVERALKAYPDIRLVVVTSPTYEGVLSDIGTIAEIAHRCQIPLLVDEAHGAHLGLSPLFPKNALQQGADLVVQSLHKTLPAFTQTAIVHVGGSYADAGALVRTLSMLETSSPSYLLMLSADRCISILEEQGNKLFEAYHQRLVNFYKKIETLKALRLFKKSTGNLPQELFDHDPGKLVISCRETGLTCSALMDVLLKEYKIQLEMASVDYAIAMTSICDTEEGFDRLAFALLEIDGRLEATETPILCFSPAEKSVQPVCLPADALSLPGEWKSFTESAFCISQEFLYAYPPGIPILAPGEQITEKVLRQAAELEQSGIRLISTEHRYPEKIRTVL